MHLKEVNRAKVIAAGEAMAFSADNEVVGVLPDGDMLTVMKVDVAVHSGGDGKAT